MDQTGNQEPSDRALAERWSAGDERGYEQLVTRYAPLVYARCRRALGAGDADDATQAVFLVLAAKRAQAVASPALAAWLFTVADFVVRNALRDRHRRREAERSMPPRHEAEKPAMDDLREHLDACLAELPAGEREAVRLHHLAGYTLAEVATHSGQPLSTVHARMQRGLGRLRTSLAKRGVAVGSLALLAGLKAEAAEPVPPTLLTHLRDLNPAGRGSGATSAPSARALAWSRPRTSLMTRIALLGAAALLFGTASYHLVTAADQPAASAPATTPRLDPDKAMMFGVLRWNDGARLVARLRTSPEGVLLPPAAEPILARIAAVQQAVVAVDPMFAVPHEVMRKSYAAQLDWDRKTPAQIKAQQEELMRLTLAGSTATPQMGRMVGRGWIEVSDPQDGLLATLQQSLAQPASPFSVAPDRLQRDGQRLTLAPVPGSPFAQLPEALLASQDPTADLEMNSYLDRGVGAGAEPIATMAFHLGPAGADFHSHSRWGIATEQQVADTLALPHVDRRRLATIPADALIAGAVALDTVHFRHSPTWMGIRPSLEMVWRMPGHEPAELARVSALLDALEQVDGHVLCWVQPGMPLPTVTVQADLSQAAGRQLLAALSTTPNADGSVTLAMGPALLQVGWKEGHLIATTRPDGLAGAVAGGGFCDHPEIVQALADMPKEGSLCCLLMRQQACAAQVGPFLAMAMGPDSQQRFAAYQQHLGSSNSYGSFRVDVRHDGIDAQAHGLIALIAGAIVAGQMVHPEQMLKAIN